MTQIINPNLNPNVIPNEPELKDLLDLVKKDVMLNINCHHIGTVQSFDETTQTAQVTINYTRTYVQMDPVTGLQGQVQRDYPLIIDAPVIVIGGGSGALTFPVGIGDECLVLFNDRDIDNWFTGGGVGPVATISYHSFSDALVLVGVRSLQKVIPNYDPDLIELRSKDGLTKVSLDPDSGDVTVTAGNAGKVTINNLTVTTDLLNALYTILTTAEAGGYPLVCDAPSLAVLAALKP